MSEPADHYDVSATPMLRLQRDRDGDDWRTGDCITPHGIVSIYDQGFTGKNPHTRLDFVVHGRLYVAAWNRTFTDRYLVTLARQFAQAKVLP